MSGPFADRLFRIAFALAGCYNLAFGLWAAVWPMAFFNLFDIALPRYPRIWACLGMVVGVYGLLYLHAAWRLESAWPIIAVGFLGKLLGPIGMLMSFDDDWPRRLGMICIYNDLIWWLPFGLFLTRGTRLAQLLDTLAPWICAIVHAIALALMVTILRNGTLVVSNAIERATYIVDYRAVWSVAWGVWMLAGMSIVAFYAWWGSRLPLRSAATAGVLLAAAGLVCDLSGEALSVLVLVERAAPLAVSSSPAPADVTRFVEIERIATLLTAGASNAFYTLGGLVLMLATPGLPTLVRAAMWITWLAGCVMTLAALFNNVHGMVLSTTVLFPLLIFWTAWMGARWRPT